jgi:hypothetical protein
MEKLSNIHYLLLGDLNSKNVLFEQVLVKSNAPNQAKEIFNRMSILKNTNTNLRNQKNKIPSANSGKKTFYYFYISENYIFIFVEADNNQAAFKLIDSILNENIHFMTNDNGILNNNGKNKIRKLLEKFQESKIFLI